MKAILYKLVIFTILLPVGLYAGNGFTGKYTKEKKITKEFEVNASAMLKIKNSYGNLYITSWDQNKTIIEVHIKTNGNNESKVQKKLDEIDVEFDASESLVFAKTIFSKSYWGWNWSNSDNVNMEINYTIKFPVYNDVDLSNDYGGIYLDKIKGKASIRCDYGRMELGELLSRGNLLKFDYTTKSSIAYVNGASIYSDYSGYTINKAEHLIIKSDYSNAKINDAGNLNYQCDYGSLSVDRVANVEGKGSYFKTSFGTVDGNVNIKSSFGNLSIEELTKNAGNVDIKSNYAGITIGFMPDYHFTFEINVEYSGFKSSDLNFSVKRNSETQKYYAGYYGSKESKNQINIKSAYGQVSLKQN